MTDYEVEFPATNDAHLAVSALPHTNKHQWLIDEVTTDFLSCLASVPNNKWRDALIRVPYEGLVGARTAPKILVECGGLKATEKLLLANKAIIDWMAIMKKKNSKANSSNGKFHWYQPST